MFTRKRVMATGLAALGAATALSTMGAGVEPRAIKISGGAELTYARQQVIDVPGAPGHQLSAGETRGTNRNTGPTDYFADAQVINAEIGDLTQGNGWNQGYYTMAKGADTVVAKWSGKVMTTMTPEGQPNTTFNGKWSYVHGTGRYAGIRGSGAYTGQFVAQDRYVVSWKGSYTQAKNRVS